MAFALASPDSTKGRVLGLLKTRAGGTAQEVAGALGITTPAARRHLSDLEAAGLVEARVEKGRGRGRPQFVYALTRNGEAHFPKQYAELCADILEHVEHLYGSGAVLEVLDARNAKLLEAWGPRVASGPIEARLEALAEILNEFGFAARVVRDGDALFLDEGNCPSLEVAQRFAQICRAEETLYGRLLGVPVRRETHILRGAASCRYRVG